MTVKSQMINSRKIFAVCCDGILVYVWYIISLQTPPSEVIVNDTLWSLLTDRNFDVSVDEIEAQQSSLTSATPTPSASPPPLPIIQRPCLKFRK